MNCLRCFRSIMFLTNLSQYFFIDGLMTVLKHFWKSSSWFFSPKFTHFWRKLLYKVIFSWFKFNIKFNDNSGRSRKISNSRDSVSKLISFCFYVKFNTSEAKCRLFAVIWWNGALWRQILCFFDKYKHF